MFRTSPLDPNVYLDTSGSDPEAGLFEYAVACLGTEQIVFGSDAPGRDFGIQLSKMTGAGKIPCLHEPFFVLATQNPIEIEGAYPGRRRKRITFRSNFRLTAKIKAILAGRYNVALEDINAITVPALRHRVLLNFEGEAEGIDTEDVVQKSIEAESASLKTAVA